MEDCEYLNDLVSVLNPKWVDSNPSKSRASPLTPSPTVLAGPALKNLQTWVKDFCMESRGVWAKTWVRPWASSAVETYTIRDVAQNSQTKRREG